MIKKYKEIFYQEYTIVPTIEVSLLVSVFFCLANPKSAKTKYSCSIRVQN